MSTRDIYIPQSLIDTLKFHRRRKEFILATVLVYSIIDGWSIRTKADTNGKKWRQINRNHFDGCAGKRNTVSKAIEWLELNNFIEIKKRISKKGEVINDNKKGKYSNRYRTKGKPKKDRTTFQVNEDAYHEANAVTETGTDWASIETRNNLALLTLTDQLIKEKNNRTNRAIWTIENNAGTVRRGRHVDRLYSEWCFANEEVRRLFLFDGEPFESFDLGSAQPTIVGKLADDKELMTACMNDQLYPAIAELLGYDPIEERKKAKQKFYRYCYGPILKDWKKQPEAYSVQDYISKTFPKTHYYAVGQKNPDYRRFARHMQNLEAEIFIDGIFAELVQLGIPALTCHDGIYCPISHASQVEQICRKHLTLFFGNHFVLNPSCHQSLVDYVCIS